MRRWNTPFVNFMHAVLVAVDVAEGVFAFRHNYFACAFDFTAALFIVGINIWSGLRRRRLQQNQGFREAALAEHTFRLEHPEMSESEFMNIHALALKNLKHVAKVTGATLESENTWAEIVIGKDRYRICPGHIYKQSLSGIIVDDTCLQVGLMPAYEQIAATLLLLKNNPKLFGRWCHHGSYHA